MFVSIIILYLSRFVKRGKSRFPNKNQDFVPQFSRCSGFDEKIGKDEIRNCFSGEQSVVCSLIREMFSCALAGGIPFQKQKMTALLTLFSIEMHRAFPSCGPGPETASIQRIHFALNEMLSRYGEEISIERLASASSLSPNQFRRVFAKATGSSPQAYLNHLRITMAASMLLRTDLTIAEIALRCGFPTLSCFNRQFRLLRGITPGKFRAGKQ